MFTDWRGDPDEQLGRPGIDDGRAARRRGRRGVDVRGLIWRSHWDKLAFSGAENRHLGEEMQAAGAEALLDMRVRTGGSHHQKLVVIRHAGRPSATSPSSAASTCATAGATMRGTSVTRRPSRWPRNTVHIPPWHDIQAAISGPAVDDVETVFRERWQDPTPLSRSPIRRLRDRLAGDDLRPDPLPPQAPPPAPVPGGTHAVQLLRTYPNLRHGRDYPFARGGERSVARGYTKALGRAERLIYVEDQYLWSTEVAVTFADALRAKPELRVIAVLPHLPDQSARLSRVPQELGRHDTMVQLLRGRSRAGGLLRHREPPRASGVRACEGLRDRRLVGDHRFGQLQPALLDP